MPRITNLGLPLLVPFLLTAGACDLGYKAVGFNQATAESGTDSGTDSESGSSSASDSSTGSDTSASIACAQLPPTVVGAAYDYSPEVEGLLVDWAASGLPPGLSIDPDSGVISGSVGGAAESEYAQVRLTALDADALEVEAECGPLFVGTPLHPDPDKLGAYDCVPYTSSSDALFGLFTGGDGSAITCAPLSPGPNACPLGPGNGRMPAGIQYDPTSCTHTGTIEEDARGTWMWIIEVQQSGVTIPIPICATNDVPAYHTITPTALGAGGDDLQPLTYGHGPNDALTLSEGEHAIEMVDPSCADDPSLCAFYGAAWTSTCSHVGPLILQSSALPQGVRHSLLANGQVPVEPFDTRLAVTSLDLLSCTSPLVGACDNDTIEQNGQTRFHLAVLTRPFQ